MALIGAAPQAAQEAGAIMSMLLQPQWALGLLVCAIVLSVAISHLVKLPGLRRVRHWLLLTRALVWTMTVFTVVFALSRLVSTEYWLVLGVLLLGLISLAALDWLRNLIAGLSLEFERNFEPGDLVRYDDIEGELVEFGTRAVMLRTDDGTRHQIPNEKFTRNSVTRLEIDGEAACEIVISLPHAVSPDRAVVLAQQAALLTPLASPRHRPEVFLDAATGKGQTIEMRIRGYAFDPAYRAHFRSDVVSRVHEMLRIESTVDS
jgi:small-conductance mechanosensitive channel